MGKYTGTFVRVLLFMLLCAFTITACDSEPSPPPLSEQPISVLVDKVKNGAETDKAALAELLRRTGPEAAKVQEEMGDYYELDNFEFAESFWKAAQAHGRPDAGPKHWAITRFLHNNASWLTWVCIVSAGVVIVAVAVAGWKNEKFQLERKERAKQVREERTKRVMQSPWWNLPAGSILLLDTCVLEWDCRSKGKQGLDSWMDWISRNAAEFSWSILIIKNVYSEVIYHKERGHTPDDRYRGRLAAQRIERMQKLAGRAMKVETTIVEDRYADPRLKKFVNKNKKAILFTHDRRLGIEMRSEAGNSQVRILDDFVPLPR